MTDTLFYGWQDGKFVLLLLSQDSKVRHRISLTPEEWLKILHDYAFPGKGLVPEPNSFCAIDDHVQVDTLMKVDQTPAQIFGVKLLSILNIIRELRSISPAPRIDHTPEDLVLREFLADYNHKSMLISGFLKREQETGDFMEALAVKLKKAEALTAAGALSRVDEIMAESEELKGRIANALI